MPAHYRVWLFATLCLAFIMVFVQHICMTVLVGDVMQSFALSPNELGVLSGAYFYTYAATQFFSGLLAERFGPRRTLSLMYTVAALGGAVFILADWYPLALVGRAMTGFGMAVVMASAFTAFNRWFSPQAYIRVCAWFFAIGGLGGYFGTGPLSWLNATIGWRMSYTLVSGLTLLAAIAVWMVVRDRPPVEPKDALPSERTITLAGLAHNLLCIAKRPDFWKLILWYLTLPGVFYAFVGLWAGVYFEQVYGLHKIQIGNILSVGSIGFIVGNPLLAWVSERFIKSHRRVLCLCGPAGFAVMAVVVLYTDSLSPPLLYLLVFVLGMAANAPNALIYAVARVLFGARMLGSVGGIFGCCSFLGGASLQVLTGFVLHYAEGRGMEPATMYACAFAPLLACTVITTAACFSLPETYGKPAAL